jgi:hypothetical protein
VSNQARITLTSPDGKDSVWATINLIDNPGVQAWQQAVRKNPRQRDVLPMHRFREPYARDPQFDRAYRDLLIVAHQLKDTDYALPEPVPSVQEISQPWCNRAHRHFTHAHQRLTENYSWDHPHYVKHYPLLSRLNDHVHMVEIYHDCWPRHMNTWFTPHITCLANMDYEAVPIPDAGQYHSWQHHDVILDAYILGKTTICSFLDDDDPRDWDTTGHHITAGGFMILFDDHRQKIYQSPEFQAWLSKYQVTKQDIPGDFPLGNLDPAHRQRLQQFWPRMDPNWRCDIELTVDHHRETC